MFYHVVAAVTGMLTQNRSERERREREQQEKTGRPQAHPSSVPAPPREDGSARKCACGGCGCAAGDGESRPNCRCRQHGPDAPMALGGAKASTPCAGEPPQRTSDLG